MHAVEIPGEVLEATKRRAQKVVTNGMRCLVSGSDTVEVAHAMPRELSKDLVLVTCTGSIQGWLN